MTTASDTRKSEWAAISTFSMSAPIRWVTRLWRKRETESHWAAARRRVIRDRMCWTKPNPNCAIVTWRTVMMTARATISAAKSATSRLNFAKRLSTENNAKSCVVALCIRPLVACESIMTEKNGMRSTRPTPSTRAPKKMKISALRPFAPEKMAKSRRNRRSGMRIELVDALVNSRLIQDVAAEGEDGSRFSPRQNSISDLAGKT